jgi:hypothetical protein
MGVTCQMSDGMLIGCHVDCGGAVEDANLKFQKDKIQAYAQSSGATTCNLYIIGDRMENRLNAGKSDFEKAAALDFKGKVWIYDTKGIATTDGWFARVRSSKNDPSGMCFIQVCADPYVRPYKNCGPQDDVSGLNVWKRYDDGETFKYVVPNRIVIRTGIKNGVQLPRLLQRPDFKFIQI